jgi:hypothetical protein
MAVQTHILKGTHPPDVMDIVRELRAMGLVQGTDFDFSYTPPDYNYEIHEHFERFTVFTFYQDKWATWFALKYL